MNINKLNVEGSLALVLEVRDESMAACDEHEVPADQRLFHEGRLDFCGPVEVCVQNFPSNSCRKVSFVCRKFQEEKVSEAENSLELIFANVLQTKKLRDVRGDELKKFKLTDEQVATIESMCQCRISRMPVQYILKEWEFRDLLLKMQVPVFIPRPETEELVELITQQLDPEKDHKILEVGCGTGCISLALLSSLPHVKQVIAIDQSRAACDLTMENSQSLGLSSRLKVFKYKVEDENLPEEIAKFGPFDVIVSNPPYVPSKDILKLAPEIFLYEDIRALESGPEGLNVIRILLKLAAKFLKPEGSLWMEVDSRHPEIIKKTTEKNQNEWKLKFISSYNDIFKKERFVEIEKE